MPHIEHSLAAVVPQGDKYPMSVSLPGMGNQIRMRSGTAQGEDSAPGVTRRVVRLLVLLGVAVAAYLVLSLFDHAARADAGSIDQSTNRVGATGPVASVKVMVGGAGKAIAEPKSISPKSTAPKAHPQRIHRPTIKTPEVYPPKVRAPKKIHAPKNQEPRKIQAPSIRAGETVRRVPVRTSKLRQPTSDAVRDAAGATVTPARTAVVRQKLSTPAQLPSLPELAELPDLPQAAPASWTRLPDLPQAELPALPQLHSWPQLPGLPQTQLPSWSQLPGLPQAQLPSWSQLPSLPPARTPVLTRTTALTSAPVPHQPLMPPVSAQVCSLPQPPAFAPASGLSGVTRPPTAQAQPRTAPLSAPPRQPADRSAPTGQARDSGGGNAPAMGTVSSSWRPEVAAAGRRLATDLLARGRTIRFAGPPS
jgi:hypothetical protein